MRKEKQQLLFRYLAILNCAAQHSRITLLMYKLLRVQITLRTRS